MAKEVKLVQRVRRLMRMQKRRADQYVIIADYWRSLAMGVKK
jgi:hypothetical protein